MSHIGLPYETVKAMQAERVDRSLWRQSVPSRPSPLARIADALPRRPVRRPAPLALDPCACSCPTPSC